MYKPTIPKLHAQFQACTAWPALLRAGTAVGALPHRGLGCGFGWQQSFTPERSVLVLPGVRGRFPPEPKPAEQGAPEQT